ncbi:MAG: hypothetical protein IJJ13_02685 [Lachnospiraceae bacterium]|nr:hypothetical protein [Lachnospiraceae bacterium]
MERNANYLNVITYAKRLKPVYEGKTYVETVPCFFSFPEAESEKYRFIYEGMETYAFPLSGKHIINGLYLLSIMNRKNLAMQDAPFYLESDIQKQIYHLLDIRAVIFQCMLVDDIHLVDRLYEAKLYTIYLLK